jgi:phosphoribosylformylglycinamidine synthase
VEEEMVYRFYRKTGVETESCFNVETTEALTSREIETLEWLLAETFEPDLFAGVPFLGDAVEIGPRLNFATAYSTNAVEICRGCGLTKVTRLERSRRVLNRGKPVPHDRMTEMAYSAPLESFELEGVPESVYYVPVLEEGEEALRRENKKLGLGMDDADIAFYERLVRGWKRNPTNVECFQLGQANSEHSRHWVLRGKIVIDGETMPETLFQVIKSTLRANPQGSVIAFSDNSSAIEGWDVEVLVPEFPGQVSGFIRRRERRHAIFTAETHSFPTGKAPRPGAETGTGGRIRDIQATGRGGLVVAGTAGYCVGALALPEGFLPGQQRMPFAADLADPLTILIEASNGCSDYGNKFGEPVIAGFCRSFDQRVYGGERRAWLKPILFSGGIGMMREDHATKGEPEVGMLVVQIGGPAYRIGVGGGGASSMIQGENTAELDFKAVQRGDAEMERKMDRVIRACIEMGEKNPIVSIHDQGAGGPSNVLTELVNPKGGRLEIRNIRSGDKTLSVLELWSAEYQERNALLIRRDRIAEFEAICRAENVGCEILGQVTGDGRIVVHDSLDDSTPVDLDLAEILGDLPQKTFEDTRIVRQLTPFKIPTEPVADLIERIFRQLSVGSKGFLVRKVDRSVTGLVARQQCCGPLQLPVSDMGIIAATALEGAPPGAATSIGEQPIKMLVDIKAGARMAVGEAITNIAGAGIRGIESSKCSVNEMWAAKLPGGIASLYDAVSAARDAFIETGLAIDGGKDSLSMAAKVDGETVQAPPSLVVSLYAAMDDVRVVATPDVKRPGKSTLVFIDLARGKMRLGGSALAQSFGEIGNISPDLDDAPLLGRAFRLLQEFVRDGSVLACHDRSDGGLVTTVIEMIMSAGCGAEISLPDRPDPVEFLFNEELGWVVEIPDQQMEAVLARLVSADVPHLVLGRTKQRDLFVIKKRDNVIVRLLTGDLLIRWERTSDAIEMLQSNPRTATIEALNHATRFSPAYALSFEPQRTSAELLIRGAKPKIAVMREEGSNGDREMTHAFELAGFFPVDVALSHLRAGTTSLDSFRGVAFVGGFSFADVMDSAKGWAGIIRHNPKLADMFLRFRERRNAFSLGVCNGCQLEALLGWIMPDLPDQLMPRFVHNESGRFEQRWLSVRTEKSPSIMMSGMEGSILGIPCAHGEGRLHASPQILARIEEQGLVPLRYVDELGEATTHYPLNPNGSPNGIAGLCSADGRHLALMPHPERAFQLWQWHYLPEEMKQLQASPWLRLFQNAREWCDNN